MHKAIEVQVAQTGSMPLKRAMELAQDATDQGDVDTRTVLLFDINDRHANARNLSIDFLDGRVPVLGIFAVRYCPQYEAYCLDGQNLGMVNSLLEFSSADISVSRRMHAPFKQSHGPVQPDLTFVLQGTFKAGVEEGLEEREMVDVGGQSRDNHLNNKFKILTFTPPRLFVYNSPLP